MINDELYRRKYVVMGIMVLIVLIYICRLFMLQVVDDKYRVAAAKNALVHRYTFPPRGLIYDRNGKLLVCNQPTYEVQLVMREIPKDGFDTVALAKALHFPTEIIRDKIREIADPQRNRNYSKYTLQTVINQLKMEDIAELQETLYKFPGFYIQKRMLRDYNYPNASHILGSIGEVSQEKIDEDDYYIPGDYTGRDGIEYTYEKDLRGCKGDEIFLRDSKGHIKGRFKEGNYDVKPEAGKDLHLTIDIELQAFGEKLLKGKLGSVVCIEPKTGEILAMVSNPNWDPKDMIGQMRSKKYVSLMKNPNKPLMNRATQATYSPGSTFKTLQACACLQLGGITPGTHFSCNGPGSSPIRCTHHHGSPVSLSNAIEQSCNPYFWQAYKATLEKHGYGEKKQKFKDQYNNWRQIIMSFGLGQRFDSTDLYQQSSGNIPSTDFYARWYGENGWKALTIKSNAIGQGEVQITPLQMANATAAIANGGYYFIPHLNKADSMKRKVMTKVDARYFPYVQEGMWRVFEYGTGRSQKIAALSMCGKTGTVDNSRGRPHSLFIGYAPRENPQIAVCVVIENSGAGATWAAPIASLMMEKYIFGEIKGPGRQEAAESMMHRSTMSSKTEKPKKKTTTQKKTAQNN